MSSSILVSSSSRPPCPCYHPPHPQGAWTRSSSPTAAFVNALLCPHGRTGRRPRAPLPGREVALVLQWLQLQLQANPQKGLHSRRKRTSGKTSLGVTQRARARQRHGIFIFPSSADTVTIAAPRRHGLGHAPRTALALPRRARRSPLARTAPHRTRGRGEGDAAVAFTAGAAGAKEEGSGRRWLHVGRPARLSCGRLSGCLSPAVHATPC